MITVLAGENDYEARRAIQELMARFDGTPERFDGGELELAKLPDIIMGMSLFATKRLVIIDQLSAGSVWAQFDEWIDRVSDDTHLVLVEPRPDKRTKTYKELQKKASIREFPVWTHKDQPKAVEWVIDQAASEGISLSREQARHLVARAGVSQWHLHHAIEKLALVDKITDERIDELVDPNPEENVFALLETALRSDTEKLQQMISTLKQTEDPYRVFGLLSTQVLQLAALVLTDKTPQEVARDIKTAPFVLSKLAPFARRLGQAEVKAIIEAAAKSDHIMKSSGVDPWVAVERLLLKIAL